MLSLVDGLDSLWQVETADCAPSSNHDQLQFEGKKIQVLQWPLSSTRLRRCNDFNQRSRQNFKCKQEGRRTRQVSITHVLPRSSDCISSQPAFDSSTRVISAILVAIEQLITLTTSTDINQAHNETRWTGLCDLTSIRWPDRQSELGFKGSQPENNQMIEDPIEAHPCVLDWKPAEPNWIPKLSCENPLLGIEWRHKQDWIPASNWMIESKLHY